MEPDGESRETAGSVRDWLSRTLLATRLRLLSKKRWNLQRVPQLALPTRLARGRKRCLFRRLCRPNSDGLLDAVEHAGAVLFPGGAVFPSHSDTGGQRLSPLSRTEPDLCAHRGGPTSGNRAARRGRAVRLVPDVLLNRVIFWLQTGSAEVTDALFQLVGVPVFRTGFVFALPGVTIEIAQECSGRLAEGGPSPRHPPLACRKKRYSDCDAVYSV